MPHKKGMGKSGMSKDMYKKATKMEKSMKKGAGKFGGGKKKGK